MKNTTKNIDEFNKLYNIIHSSNQFKTPGCAEISTNQELIKALHWGIRGRTIMIHSQMSPDASRRIDLDNENEWKFWNADKEPDTLRDIIIKLSTKLQKDED